MNFGRGNSGHSSIENIVVEPAQMVSNSDPSIVDMQSSTSASKQLHEILKSPASAQQQIPAILHDNPQLMAALIKQQHQPVLQQQQRLLNPANMAGNHTMKPQLVVPNPGPSIAGMQTPRPAWKQLLETSKALGQQQVPDYPRTKLQLKIPLMKQKRVHQLAQKHQCPQQQWQMLPNEGNMTENHAIRLEEASPNLDPTVADIQSHSPTTKQLFKSLKSLASAELKRQDLTIPKAKPKLMVVNMAKQHDADLQKQQQFLQQSRLFLQRLQQRFELCHQQELQHQRQRRHRRLVQRQQRRQMLLEHYVTGYPTMRPHRVLPNLDPSITDMQRPAEDCQQILENLNALNLE